MKLIFSKHEIESNYFIHFLLGKKQLYPKLIPDKIKIKSG